ncbi:hypothetical protein [Paludibacterium denitrificans]|uniref:Uncharacterized protein n=1 Tax=Paludibacterium denitrificans TaxID=2675226 RepID=A0A844G980_9NEIS|nr:hypothetical protein [Paludibacterium denitrificans]MTD32342.1 hypothetical protein [Paludibacterium denitrificans]
MWFVLVLLLVVVAAAGGWWVYAGRPDPAQLRERLQQQLSQFDGQQWLNRLTGWVRLPPRLQTFPLGADLLKRLDRLLGTDESEPIEPMLSHLP